MAEQKEGRRWLLYATPGGVNKVMWHPGSKIEAGEEIEVMPVSEAQEQIEAAEANRVPKSWLEDALRHEREAEARAKAAEKRAEEATALMAEAAIPLEVILAGHADHPYRELSPTFIAEIEQAVLKVRAALSQAQAAPPPQCNGDGIIRHPFLGTQACPGCPACQPQEQEKG